MRIDYCPKCNKAGLKYESEFHVPAWMDNKEREKEVKRGIYGLEKWCPRCGEWVKPINKPYLAKRT